jgi:hypothetical protein
MTQQGGGGNCSNTASAPLWPGHQAAHLLLPQLLKWHLEREQLIHYDAKAAQHDTARHGTAQHSFDCPPGVA